MIYKNLKNKALLLCFIIILPLNSYGGNINQDYKKITIKIEPSLNGNHDHPIKLSFIGKEYTNGLWFSQTKKAKHHLNDVEQFIIKVIKTNTTGTIDEVVSLWHPNEQTAIKKVASDAELFKRNLSFYKSIKDSAVKSVIMYGSYTVCFIEHTSTSFKPFIKDYVIIKYKKKYYLSNTLSEDAAFQYIARIYSKLLPL